MKRLIALIVLFMAAVTLVVQTELEVSSQSQILWMNKDGTITNVPAWTISNVFFTNQLIDVRLVITLQTNWVPVDTLTGRREVGIVVSNTYARVMWNCKTNDYVQESVVIGQPLIRDQYMPTNRFLYIPSWTNWTNFIIPTP